MYEFFEPAGCHNVRICLTDALRNTIVNKKQNYGLFRVEIEASAKIRVVTISKYVLGNVSLRLAFRAN